MRMRGGVNTPPPLIARLRSGNVTATVPQEVPGPRVVPVVRAGARPADVRRRRRHPVFRRPVRHGQRDRRLERLVHRGRRVPAGRVRRRAAARRQGRPPDPAVGLVRDRHRVPGTAGCLFQSTEDRYVRLSRPSRASPDLWPFATRFGRVQPISTFVCGAAQDVCPIWRLFHQFWPPRGSSDKKSDDDVRLLICKCCVSALECDANCITRSATPIKLMLVLARIRHSRCTI